MARAMKDSGVEWIGEIPEGWETSKIKHLFKVYSGATPKSENPAFFGGEIAWVTPADYKTGQKFVCSGKRNLTQAGYESCQATLVPAGSLIFSKRAPIGTVAISASPLCTNQGCLSCVPFNNVDSRLYYYSLSILDEVFNVLGAGTTFKEISYGVFCNTPIAVPSVEEQQRIADFLDTRTAEIDASIAKTQESIEEYKKLKQAVITQAVTKGIRPGRVMKDSGVEWIGEIPEDWSIDRVKHHFSLRTERNTLPLNEVNLLSLYTEKGVVQHDDLEETTGNKAATADGYKQVYPDDIVVNIILCWMGAIGRSAYKGVTSPAYDVYVPYGSTHSLYFHYLFRTKTFAGECYKYGRGIMAMRWRTYSTEFRAIRIPVPPLAEQQEIAAYLDEKCAAIDTLIEKKHAIITELEAYKKSLIYEYVTGKKEVPVASC